MTSFGSVLLGAAALISTVHASPWASSNSYDRFAPRIEGFNWTNCAADYPSRECSSFEVPLDWADDSAGKAALAVARYKATKQPKIGTLFMNPVGPGGSGVDTILSAIAETMSEASGGQYDILSWDPRGIGRTMPRAECFESWTEEDVFWNNTIPRLGLEARGNFTDQRDFDAFYEQVDEVDTLLEQLGKHCIAYSPDTFQYIGTAAAVRDMVAMHDALEGSSKPVDYWGLSYGTAVGIYFVNMFPDRVGRVVLDGVLDPEYWANRPAHEMWGLKTESTDEAVTGFVTASATAGPSGCALANNGSTPDSIRQQLRDLLDAAYDYRHAVGPSAKITSAYTRLVIYGGMYSPGIWPQVAEELAGYIQELSNISSASNSMHARSVRVPLLEFERRQDPSNETATILSHDYTFQGVTCADAIDPGNVTTKDTFDFLVKVTREVSQMFGPVWKDAGMYCHRWPVRAVERYTGPWDKKLANPILVIGNEGDPVTPYASAKKVADALGDSAILIEQDDYGISTYVFLAAIDLIHQFALSICPSRCVRTDMQPLLTWIDDPLTPSCSTISALKDYFLNNTLPRQDKLCGTDQQLFPSPGITKNTLAKTTSQNLSIDSDSLQDGLDKARARSQTFFVAVIALATVTGILLVCLIFSCIRGRRRSSSAHVTYIPRIAFKKGGDEQGHVYNDPFVKGADTKSGGYSRVVT